MIKKDMKTIYCQECGRQWFVPVKSNRKFCPGKECSKTRMRKISLNGDIAKAYKLGLADGGDRLKHTHNLIYKTFRTMFEQLLFIDEKTPDCVNKVILTRSQAEGIIRALRKAGKFYQARKLQRIMDSQLGAGGSQQAQLREEINNDLMERAE
jgi:hypothetical protein